MNEAKLPDGVIVFERGWLSANNILFVGNGSTALFDSGYCTHATQTVDLVTATLGEKPLDLLLNTHLHSDHCGGNAALQALFPDLQTFIPPGQAKSVSPWDPDALTYLPTGQLCPAFGFDKVLLPGNDMELGDTIWETYAAPGHDPYSLIFFEPRSKTLISADALWEKGFGVVFPELEGATAFDEVSATFDLIERLSPKTVIPGHGPVFNYRKEVLANARQRLDAFVKNPSRHAHYAAKVLLKFKLLERQQLPEIELLNWARATPYFRAIHEKFFLSVPTDQWIEKLIDELASSGAAQRRGMMVLNS
jgi:glyoxylase-like metal-dependent hydrolase (beta-lactamase superfamily II)